jgi:glycosyltransferase involved in cell wall biosynthesis
MGNTRLRVLHVGPKNFPPNHGGVEKVVYDIVTGMEQVESHVLTEWDNPPWLRTGTLRPGVIAAFRQIKQYCRDQTIDIVHLHKESFIPHSLLLSLTGVRCVLTIHGCSWRLARWPFYCRMSAFVLDCLACLWGPKVVFVGERDWMLFRRMFFFRRSHWVRNGVNGAPSPPETKKDKMVYLGRLSPEKNILNLIQAAQSCGSDLDLYGPFDRHDPDFQDAVLTLLKNCSHIRWHGTIPFDQVRRTLAGYKVFVNPSYSEGLPLSVLEAAAEGLYLILSDIPQHRSLGFPACTYVDPDRLAFESLSANHLDGTPNGEHVRNVFSMDKMIRGYQMVSEEGL